MDHLFTPWRYSYVTTADSATTCIFCDCVPDAASTADIEPRRTDPDNLDLRNLDLSNLDLSNLDLTHYVVHRGPHCFIILNRYPYTCGHVMIVPYQHLDRLELLPLEAANEMMALAQRMEGVLRRLYQPDGINMGINIGKAAGAGVAGHIHMHVLPRWVADANFMSVVGETRVLPESLEETARRIREALAK